MKERLVWHTINPIESTTKAIGIIVHEEEEETDIGLKTRLPNLKSFGTKRNQWLQKQAKQSHTKPKEIRRRRKRKVQFSISIKFSLLFLFFLIIFNFNFPSLNSMRKSE